MNATFRLRGTLLTARALACFPRQAEREAQGLLRERLQRAEEQALHYQKLAGRRSEETEVRTATNRVFW